MPSTPDESTGIPLDYGKELPAWKRYWNRFRSAWREYSEHWWESLGYVVGMAAFSVGGPKQLTLAFGLAFAAGGLGLAVERGDGGSGPFWMWIGGFLIGLVIPLSKSGAEK